MKIVGVEKLSENRKRVLNAGDIDVGTTFRYEVGTNICMKAYDGIVDLTDGQYVPKEYDSYEDGSEEYYDSFWTAPIKIVETELHIIKEIKEEEE